MTFPTSREIVDEVARNPRASDLVCLWEENAMNDEDYWETECGHAFIFNEGGVTENYYKFCPYCGKPIREVRRAAE